MRSFHIKLWLVLIIAGIAIAVSCSSSQQHTKENQLITERIFSYQFEHVRLRDSSQLYFLSLGDGKDPTVEFMKKFDGSLYPVKSYSESVYKNGIITDIATGQRGIRLEVKDINWLSKSEVEVKGSWFAGHENYQEQVFRVRKKDGTWIVESVKGILDP